MSQELGSWANDLVGIQPCWLDKGWISCGSVQSRVFRLRSKKISRKRRVGVQYLQSQESFEAVPATCTAEGLFRKEESNDFSVRACGHVRKPFQLSDCLLPVVLNRRLREKQDLQML